MAVLTALPPNSRLQSSSGRRHSDPSKSIYPSGPRNGQVRASSSGGAGGLDSHPHREAAIVLPPVPEDTPVLAHSISRDSEEEEERSASTDLDDSEFQPLHQQQPQQPQNRWSKHLSWIPGWSFAGPLTPPASPPAEGSDSLERSTSNESYLLHSNNNPRMSRIRSSITTLSEVVLRDTEPTHESNFPANPVFSTYPGYSMLLNVYGTIDTLTVQGMRLQTPRGGITPASFDGSNNKGQYMAILEYIRPLLRNGDLLVRPFIERYARADRYTAMVVRGAIQDTVFKCMVVGVFPMKMFDLAEVNEGKGFESYELRVEMYDHAEAEGDAPKLDTRERSRRTSEGSG